MIMFCYLETAEIKFAEVNFVRSFPSSLVIMHMKDLLQNNAAHV